MINKEMFCSRSSEIIYEPIRARTMCPALMFAASRKERVAGRTMILIVSAKVRNGFSQSGAPSGRRAAVKAEILFFIDLIISAIQRGSPKDRVKRRWLDEGRTYGIRPVQFVKIKNKNSGLTSLVIPLIDLPRVRLIWSFMIDMGSDRIWDVRVGEIQKNDWIVIIGRRLASQMSKVFDDWSWDEVWIRVGSNDEKRSVIIRARKGMIFFLRFEALVFI